MDKILKLPFCEKKALRVLTNLESPDSSMVMSRRALLKQFSSVKAAGDFFGLSRTAIMAWPEKRIPINRSIEFHLRKHEQSVLLAQAS